MIYNVDWIRGKMKFIRELKRCLKHGILERILLFILPVIITIISCLQVDNRSICLSCTDINKYLFFLYRGMPFPKESIEIIPSGLWIFNCIYPILITALYINESKDTFFKTELLKLNDKKIWLFARYITSVLITILTIVIQFVTVCFYVFLNKKDVQRDNLKSLNTYIDTSKSGEVFSENMLINILIMLIVMLAFISLMFLLSFIINILLSSVIIIMLIVATVYLNLEGYIGNLLMFKRAISTNVVYANIILALIIIAISIAGIVVLSGKVDEDFK